MVVAVLGAGGHGQDVAAIVRATGHAVEFFDDDPALGFRPCADADRFLIGVHDSRTRARMDRPSAESFISTHPAALVDPSVVVDYGTVIGAGAVVGVGVTTGRHVHVGQGSSLVRTSCGDYVTISPGAVVCGDVELAEGVMVGAGAVVSNLCTVGEYAVIGAGAVLPPRTVVPAGAVWVGNPARPLRDEVAA